MYKPDVQIKDIQFYCVETNLCRKRESGNATFLNVTQMWFQYISRIDITGGKIQ